MVGFFQHGKAEKKDIILRHVEAIDSQLPTQRRHLLDDAIISTVYFPSFLGLKTAKGLLGLRVKFQLLMMTVNTHFRTPSIFIQVQG